MGLIITLTSNKFERSSLKGVQTLLNVAFKIKTRLKSYLKWFQPEFHIKYTDSFFNALWWSNLKLCLEFESKKKSYYIYD